MSTTISSELPQKQVLLMSAQCWLHVESNQQAPGSRCFEQSTATQQLGTDRLAMLKHLSCTCICRHVLLSL
jgi:hypothetical protein